MSFTRALLLLVLVTCIHALHNYVHFSNVKKVFALKKIEKKEAEKNGLTFPFNKEFDKS